MKKQKKSEQIRSEIMNYLVSKNIDLKELAEKSKVRPVYIGSFMAGTSDINTSTLDKIFDVING